LSDHDRLRDWLAFAGIVWGGSEHQLCVLDAQGTRLTQQRVTHDVAGLAQLDTLLAQHGAALPVAVERAEGLLVEHLQARGHTVFPVSPRIAARARERYRVAAVKDDRLDAFVLADTLRHEHLHRRASASSFVRSFSASFSAARSERSLPGLSIWTLSTSTMRSPVDGSSPADTRTS
jgi:transposase